MTIRACLASMGAVCAVSGKTVSNPRRRASWNRRVITAELYAWAFGGRVSVPATVTLVTDRLPSGGPRMWQRATVSTKCTVERLSTKRTGGHLSPPLGNLA